MKTLRTASSLHRSIPILALALSMFAGGAAPTLVLAQPQNANAPQPAANSADEPVIETVHGIVLSALDNQPVARVLITSPDLRMATLSDRDGRFAFDISRYPNPTAAAFGQPTLSYQQIQQIIVLSRTQSSSVWLTARRPGYLQQQGPIPLPLFASAGPPPEITLKITPAATLCGHVSGIVSDPSTPEPRLLVSLTRKQIQDGAAVWISANSTQPNSQGDFCIGDLPPGEYKVMARGGGVTAGPGTRPKAGYLPAFSGDASSLAEAAPIAIASGQTAQVRLNLHRADFYTVTIPIINPSGQPVMVDIASSRGTLTSRGSLFDGPIQLSLAEGASDVLLATDGNPSLSASLHITVAGAPVQTAPVTLNPPADIPVNLHEQFTQTETPAATPGDDTPGLLLPQRTQKLNLTLIPEDTNTPAPSLPQFGKPTDNLVLHNVGPGAYRVSASSPLGYVASIQAGGVDLLRQPLVIGPGGSSDPIDVTLRNDSATLTGTISDPSDANGPLEVTVVAIPLDNSFAAAIQTASGTIPSTPPVGITDRVRIMYSSVGPYPGMQQGSFDNGTFTFHNLAPGPYLLLAWASHPQSNPLAMVNIEYRNPKVLQEYASRGTQVNLLPGNNPQVQVPLLTGNPPR